VCIDFIINSVIEYGLTQIYYMNVQENKAMFDVCVTVHH